VDTSLQNPAVVTMDVQWSNNQEVMVTLQGELRMASVSTPRQHLLQLARKGPRLMVIDLAEVSTIDTAGIAILVEVLRAMHACGGKLKLFGLTDQVKRMVELTSLDQVIDVYESRRAEQAPKRDDLSAG
jgi:anti-sigma B factor antagonist